MMQPRQNFCTRLHHVCRSARDGEGCSSCGKTCHRAAGDPLCGFSRRRGLLTWFATEQELKDTQAGTGGNLPHITQVNWSIDIAAKPNRLVVNGVNYFRGHGDPGKTPTGECRNNCLIDTLRQCLRINADPEVVRQDLLRDYANASMPATVGERSMLDLGSHWQAIVRSLFAHNQSGLPTEINIHDYCVIGLYYDVHGNSANHGDVMGNLNARQKLIVLNEMDVHFDPCLPELIRVAAL